MSGMTIGYVRVSSADQSVQRQLDGINLDKVFTDKASGKNTQRPALKDCMDFVRDGDNLVVHSMDRMARNAEDMLRLVRGLTDKGVTVHFMKENLIFSGDDNPMAKVMLTVMAAFAEFERNMIRERQREGIVIAKAAGKFKGRAPKLDAAQAMALRAAIDAGLPKQQVADQFGISRKTVYEYMSRGTSRCGIALAP